jgi:predicted RNA-binding protein with TRAM domain
MSYRRGSGGGGFRGGYGDREGRSFGPKPVEVGRVYDLEVTDTSKRGEGVAKVEGLVVFIPGARPGQKLKVRITRVSQRFAVGEPAGAGGAEKAEETGVKSAEEAEDTGVKSADE